MTRLLSVKSLFVLENCACRWPQIISDYRLKQGITTGIQWRERLLRRLAKEVFFRIKEIFKKTVHNVQSSILRKSF